METLPYPRAANNFAAAAKILSRVSFPTAGWDVGSMRRLISVSVSTYR